MASSRRRVEEVVPAAGRTVHSLRDIGYELPQAVADIVDNSIEADATTVSVDIEFAGEGSWIRIADDGVGMDTTTISESLRIGSTRDYGEDDLGKFGFGLKTASISQCRRLVVASRIALERARIEARAFDIDHIERTNKWEVLVLGPDERPPYLTEPLQSTTGTVVVWERLDRIMTYKDPSGQWARRSLLEQTEAVAQHLGMVFHRFLSGKARGRKKIEIYVNDSLVEPWDPFCLQEPATETLEPSYYQVSSEGAQGIVTVQPHVLPGQSEFSSTAAWTNASGPNKWNNQQGLYIYRADRLIQWGGWNRLRTNDEHTKLARVALEFTPDLDAAFGINISKAIVKLPADLRDEIQPTIKRVCAVAQEHYRSSVRSSRPTPAPRPKTSPPPTRTPTEDPKPKPAPASPIVPPLGLPPLAAPEPQKVRTALEDAASEAGEAIALERIVKTLEKLHPEVAHELGW